VKPHVDDSFRLGFEVATTFSVHIQAAGHTPSGGCFQLHRLLHYRCIWAESSEDHDTQGISAGSSVALFHPKIIISGVSSLLSSLSVGIDIRQRLFFHIAQNTDGVIGLDILFWLGIILMLLAWLLALHWYIESGIGLGLHWVCLFCFVSQEKGTPVPLVIRQTVLLGHTGHC